MLQAVNKLSGCTAFFLRMLESVARWNIMLKRLVPATPGWGTSCQCIRQSIHQTWAGCRMFFGCFRGRTKHMNRVNPCIPGPLCVARSLRCLECAGPCSQTRPCAPRVQAMTHDTNPHVLRNLPLHLGNNVPTCWPRMRNWITRADTRTHT